MDLKRQATGVHWISNMPYCTILYLNLMLKNTLLSKL